MSNSKARFQQSASSSTVKNAVVKSSVNGSKAVAGTKTAVTNAAGIAGKASSQVQVIFNGKILTPQSLIQRKSYQSDGQHKKNKVDRGFVDKNETIDEDAPDEVDKPVLPTTRAKRLESTAGLSGHAASSNQVHGSKGAAASSNPSMLFGKNKNVVEEFCTIQLQETTTRTIFSLPSLVVASDTREIIVTDERNARYEAVVKSHLNVDGFSSRPTQTRNLPQKNQNEMAAPNALRDAGTQAAAYDIKDATCGTDTSALDTTDAVVTGTDTGAEELAGLSNSVRKFVLDTVGVSMVTPGCLLDTTNVVKPLGYGELSNQGKPAKHKGRTGAGAPSGVNAAKVGTAVASSGAGTSGDDHNSEHMGPDAVGNVPIKKVDSGSASKDNGVSASSDNNYVNPSGVQGSKANNSSDNPDGSTGDNGPVFSAEDSQELMREAEIKTILSNPVLLKRLHMIERAIQQNANHRPQLDYRDLPDIEPLSLLSTERAKALREAAEGKDGKAGMGLGKGKGLAHIGGEGLGHALGGTLLGGLGQGSTADSTEGEAQPTKKTSNPEGAKVKKLFSYSNAELIQGRAVTAMVWNAVSSDLLAVGYGKTDVISDVYKPGEALDEEKQGGLVLFWSLRNPDYPEKILRTAQPVTALDFSKQHPMTLAVGLLNGDVNVYDVRREGANWGVPVESSAGMAGGHTDPVWHLKWIIKGAERLETLVSISTDGRVLEWNLKKGLVVSSLMQLKKSGTGEGWISNSAAGLSLDFHPTDPSTYITGTEDGSLHRCSVSYNEQYLDTYQGHEGPIYRIRFSQRWPSVFLTCSADWSLNLYHLKFKNPMLSMRATGENFPINDISWCPDNSTVFANVTVDAKLQIWDLSVSSIDPVVTLDTTLEDNAGADADGAETETASVASPPGSPLLTTTRYDRIDHSKEDGAAAATGAPLQRIIKNLSLGTKKKVLTCVLFGEKNPSVVVGDNRGTVTVYRIFEPVTITHLGPLQQYEKLKKAILQQTDPASAANLQAADASEEEKAY